ncbi:MAG: hypothetical protein WC867_00410 [Candidatus Pacearchaeota archaeon]|jgi:hypothetical protein
MPSMNIYTSREKVNFLEYILPGLREFTAQELSCENRKLISNEISLRVIVPVASLSIADTELEIKAFSYPERIQRQDKICLSIRDYVQRTCPQSGSVYVWLQLSELGAIV